MQTSSPARALSAARPLARRLAVPVLFSLLMVAAAYVRIPIPGNPVPLTLQVVVALLAGAFLPPVSAALSMAGVLGLGALGAPVFAGGAGGPAHLLGPTGGYLIGFVAGAALCSRLMGGRRASFGRVVCAMAAGVAAIHLLGVLHLAVYLGGNLPAAFRFGSSQFLLVDLLKILLAASFCTAMAPFSRPESPEGA